MKTPHEIIETYGAWVDQEIHQWFLDRASSLPLYNIAEYHMGWRDESLKQFKATQGKMLRPVLCLLSYQIFREDLPQIFPHAAAIELYHNHTLVLDDIQDGDRFRRDRATVWNLFGVGQGINVGLILGYLALHFLLSLSGKGFSKEKIFLLLQEMKETMIDVAEGQSMDLDFEKKPEVGEEEYLDMIGKKTGSLISFSTYSGAFLGQENPEITRIFKNFGRQLGIAMQIRDDLVGIWGMKSVSGKENGKDLWRRKKTFPVAKAFALLQGKKLSLFQNYFSSKNDPDQKIVDELIQLLDEAGIQEICLREANAMMEKVFRILQQAALDTEHLAVLERFSRHAFDSIGTLRQPIAVSEMKQR